MSTQTSRSKGQITRPAAVRAVLGVDAGDRVAFIKYGPDCFELVAATQLATELKGMIRTPLKPVTITAMNTAIVTQAATLR